MKYIVLVDLGYDGWQVEIYNNKDVALTSYNGKLFENCPKVLIEGEVLQSEKLNGWFFDD